MTTQNDPVDSAINELAADLEAAQSAMSDSDSQFHRRVFVRSLFAYLEGYAYWMRQNAIDIDNLLLKKQRSIDWRRHLLLYEDFPTIDDNGSIKETKQKISFKNRFSFSLRAFAAIVQHNEKLFSENGWCRLQDALKVRDRLMHPRKRSDVVVTDDDLAACRDGYRWFADVIVNKFRASADTILNRK